MVCGMSRHICVIDLHIQFYLRGNRTTHPSSKVKPDLPRTCLFWLPSIITSPLSIYSLSVSLSDVSSSESLLIYMYLSFLCLFVSLLFI